MRYRLRTLLIVLATGPPLVAMIYLGGPWAIIPAICLASYVALRLDF
jgi:hypothetical protein